MQGDKLKVLGMTFHAYHGLDDSEQINGQRFEVDVEMLHDGAKAAQSDRLKDTIDVRQIYRVVHDIIINKRFYLIETVSQRIADEIFDKFDVNEITIRVRKPFAPLGGLANGTEVEITRRRS